MTPEVLDQIFSHAEATYPAECCGLVVLTHSKQVKVVECDNTDPEPEKAFQIDAKHLHEASQLGDVIFIYHSHPDASPNPSSEDAVQSEELMIPFLIVAWPSKQTAEYHPKGLELQLIGRTFLYGVYDCSTLCRDYYRQKLNLEVEDYPTYEIGWWNEPLNENRYSDGLLARNFVEVPSLQPYDLILMQILAKVPNHLAVYVGDSHMIHHLFGRKSELAVFGGAWEKQTRKYFRHKTLL